MTTTINNEHKKLNVPNLRFKEFEGEWEKCKLGDVMNFLTTRVNSSELNEDNYVSTENMLQDYQGIVDAKSVPEDVNVISFSCGDILISNIRPYLKKVWKATYNGGCSSDVFVLKANDNIESDYLHYVIANDKFINFVMSGAKGVKMPRGDKKQMKTYCLSLPQIQEQKKISTLLRLIDERISTQSKIIDKLKSLIKGIDEVVFQSCSKHCKLKEFDNQITAGRDKVEEGCFPLYGSTGVIGTTATPSYHEPLVLVARVGSIGCVQFVNIPCGVSDNTIVIRCGSKAKYVYYYLQNYNFERITSGTTQPLITAKDVKHIDIPIIDSANDLKAINTLDTLNMKLELESNLYNTILKQKAFLLQQMFI